MTPAELREARLTLGLKQVELGAMLGHASGQQVSDCEAGRKRLPTTATILMRLYLMLKLDGYVLPEGWPGGAE